MISNTSIKRRNFPRSAILCGAVAALYFVLARIGLSLAFIHPSATAVWPATGFSLALVLMIGRGVWPGIFLGAFWANFAVSGHIPSSLGIAAGNTIEACAGAFLISRFAGGVRAFESPGGVFKFILLAAGFSTALSATIGAGCLVGSALAPAAQAGKIWLTWWLGDAISDLVIAPFLITCFSDFRRWNRTHDFLERAAFFVALLLLAQLIFGSWLPDEIGRVPIEHLWPPVLIWLSFQFGLRGGSAAVFAMSLVALFETLNGRSSFAVFGLQKSILLLQAFMGTAAITALALGALLFQRKESERKILELNRELERRLKELKQSEEQFRQLADWMPQIVWTAQPDGRVDYYNRGWREYTGVQEGDRREDWPPILHADDSASTIDAWHEAVEKGEPYEMEYRLRARDGSYSWFLGRAHPVKDEKGLLIRWIGTCTNIDKKKKTEGNLQENVRERTAQLLQKTRRLERFFRITVNREHEMIRLKREINELLQEGGKPKKYLR